MKIFTFILIVLAISLIGYNFTIIDFNSPLTGDSIIAIIGVIAALCAILLLLIFNQSQKIQQRIKDRE